MHFCPCGSSECICERRCTCIQRYCSCMSCHDLLRKDWCKVCDSPSTYRELHTSSTALDVCKCSSSATLNLLDLAISSEDAGHGSGPSVAVENESGTQDFKQTCLNQSTSRTEQELSKLKSIGGFEILPEKTVHKIESTKFAVDDSQKSIHQPALDESPDQVFFSSESNAVKEFSSSALQGSSRALTNSSVSGKRGYKVISLTGHMIHPKDYYESSPEERVKQSLNFPPSNCGVEPSKRNRSMSEKSKNSLLNRLGMTEEEWNLKSRANAYLVDDSVSEASKVRISSVSPDEVDSLRSRSLSGPSFRVKSGTFHSHDSPTQTVSTILTNVLVSPSGRLQLLPPLNFQPSPSRTKKPIHPKPSSSSSARASTVEALPASASNLPHSTLCKTASHKQTSPGKPSKVKISEAPNDHIPRETNASQKDEVSESLKTKYPEKTSRKCLDEDP